MHVADFFFWACCKLGIDGGDSLVLQFYYNCSYGRCKMKKSMKRLPEGEFQLMKALWHMPAPVTAPRLTEHLATVLPSRSWRPQTITSMLLRLEKKGFLH